MRKEASSPTTAPSSRKIEREVHAAVLALLGSAALTPTKGDLDP